MSERTRSACIYSLLAACVIGSAGLLLWRERVETTTQWAAFLFVAPMMGTTVFVAILFVGRFCVGFYWWFLKLAPTEQVALLAAGVLGIILLVRW